MPAFAAWWLCKVPCLRYRLLLEDTFSIIFLRHVTLCNVIDIGCNCGKGECMLPRVFYLVLPTSLALPQMLAWWQGVCDGWDAKERVPIFCDLLTMNASNHEAINIKHATIVVVRSILNHQAYHCTLQAASSNNRVVVCQLKRTTSGYPNTMFTLASNHLIVTGSAQHSPTLSWLHVR